MLGALVNDSSRRVISYKHVFDSGAMVRRTASDRSSASGTPIAGLADVDCLRFLVEECLGISRLVETAEATQLFN